MENEDNVVFIDVATGNTIETKKVKDFLYTLTKRAKLSAGGHNCEIVELKLRETPIQVIVEIL